MLRWANQRGRRQSGLNNWPNRLRFEHEAQMSRRSQQADRNDRNSTELVGYEHEIDQAQQEVICQTQRP